MTCSPFDLRDYLFKELSESGRRELEAHLKTCAGCCDELERLRATEAALLTLRDEEVPQRIGFVSDKIFDPSPLRRWWAAFWGSAARLGFASAAILSVAILIAAFHRPTPTLQSPTPNRSLEAEFQQRLDEAIQKAVSDSEARQAKKTAALLAAAEKRYDLEQRATRVVFAESLDVLMKRFNVLRASATYEEAR